MFLELAEIGHFLLRKDSYLLRDGLRRLSRAPQVVKKLSTIEIIQSSITTWQTLIFITWQTISKPNIFDISSPQKYIVEIFAKCWLVFFKNHNNYQNFPKLKSLSVDQKFTVRLTSHSTHSEFLWTIDEDNFKFVKKFFGEWERVTSDMNWTVVNIAHFKCSDLLFLEVYDRLWC